MTETNTKNLPAKVDIVDGSLVAQDLDGLWRIAGIYAASGLVPKEFKKQPEKVFVVLATGLELGLGYMAALQSIGVINGKPGVYGDGIPGLVYSRKQCEDMEEYYELDGEQMEHYDGEADLNKWPHKLKAVCIIKRKGMKTPFKGFFSVADAIRQGSWNKPTDSGYLSVWQKHPLRMLKMRARAFAARDGFADHLKGLGVMEELRDIPQVEYEAEAEVVEQPKSDLDTALELQDGQPVNSGMDDPQTKEEPQEAPLSEPEAPKQHLLVAAMLNRGLNQELIDAFCAMAAEHNGSSVDKLMDEAYKELDEFEHQMRAWGKEFMPSPEETAAAMKEDLAEEEVSTPVENSQSDESPFQDTPPAEIDSEGFAADMDPDKKKEILKSNAAALGTELKPASELENTVEIHPETGKAMTDEAWCSYFVDQYKMLKKTEYSPFVLKNTAGFAKLYKVAPSLYQKAQLKWKRFYPKDEWPVSASMREGE